MPAERLADDSTNQHTAALLLATAVYGLQTFARARLHVHRVRARDC